LRDVFTKMDVTDTGTISREEFHQAMALQSDVKMERIDEIFNQLDVGCTGEVGYSEFVAASLGGAHKSLISNASSLLVAFNTLDTDGDGYITIEDLERSLSNSVDKAQLQAMVDPDNGLADEQGRVNLENFRAMMLRGMRRSTIMQPGAQAALLQELSKEVEKETANGGRRMSASDEMINNAAAAVRKFSLLAAPGGVDPNVRRLTISDDARAKLLALDKEVTA